MNIFLNDESFRKIVLGENYFKITGMDKQGYRAPEMCISQSPIDSIHSSASALSSPIDVLRKSLIFTSQSILKLLFQLTYIPKKGLKVWKPSFFNVFQMCVRQNTSL